MSTPGVFDSLHLPNKFPGATAGAVSRINFKNNLGQNRYLMFVRTGLWASSVNKRDSVLSVSELLADLLLSLISWTSAASLDHFFVFYRETRNGTCILCWSGNGQLGDKQRNWTSILCSQLPQWLSCRSEQITILSQGRAFLHEDILLYKVILPQGFEGLLNSEYFTWPEYITEYFILSSAFVYSEPSVIPPHLCRLQRWPIKSLKLIPKSSGTSFKSVF